jgi:nicotinate phosphoribosyltransferase
MVTDLYQLTMMQGHFVNGTQDRIAVFDVYYRAGQVLQYSVFAGLQQVIEYINNIKFVQADIDYLRTLGIFGEGFLQALLEWKWQGDVYSVVEGEIIFPDTPLMIVQAPIWQAQLIESAILSILGHQSLVSTRACRMKIASNGKTIVEYGLRRAHGTQAGNYASRAAYIGGCVGTSNVYAGQVFGIPVKGTHGHAWVQSHEDELTAFRAYAKIYPDQCLLLVDTYDTLRSGLPNAITVFKELINLGHRPVGVRIDSGDLAYLSKQVRRELDKAGFEDAIILVSGDIDEGIIQQLNLQEAKIDAWGIGGKLVTGYPNCIFGLVYKLACIEQDGVMQPKLKISNHTVKTSSPGIKQMYRIYQGGKAYADLVTLQGEELNTPLTLTHPIDRNKSTTLYDYTVRNLHVQIYAKGKLVYNVPNIESSRQHLKFELDKFWTEYTRNISPQIYKVDISDQLYNLKQNLIRDTKSKFGK